MVQLPWVGQLDVGELFVSFVLDGTPGDLGSLGKTVRAVARMPTSQNRDMGHPAMGPHEWGTRHLV